MTWNSFSTIGNPQTGFCFTGANFCPACPQFCGACPFVDATTLYVTPLSHSGHPALDLQPTELYYNAVNNTFVGYATHYGLAQQGFDWTQWVLSCKDGGNSFFPDLCANVPWCWQVYHGGCTQGQTFGAYGQISCDPFIAQGMGVQVSAVPSPMPTLFGCFPQEPFLVCHVSLIGNGNGNYPLGLLNGNYPLNRVGPAFWQATIPLQPPSPNSTPNQYGTINFGSLVSPVDIGAYGPVCYGIGITAYNLCAIFGVANYPPQNCNESGTIEIVFAYNNGSGSGIYDCSPGSVITITN